ncbi:phosphoheptose isomerase [Acinetobacter phage Acj9]|uniref:Conserved hypothetical phage protein n=1 Tax=Acinetobacter phage Acj9 TaxID=760939 RepID=E5EPL7_9CAUD|nr:phosphoheptose isomerase [Acinetobacter phage Acj9]ADG59983.1 conserved hypothetical phage protein [Acinetobacter phage Acj9]
MKKQHFCFDVDNTITAWCLKRDYENFKPDTQMVEMINALYDQGHHIVLYTARGMKSVGPGRIATEIVPSLVKNLEKIGLKYHELMTHKPLYDWIIDDKAMDPQTFKDHFNAGTLTSVEPYVPEIA